MNTHSPIFTHKNRRRIGVLFVASVIGCIFLILMVITNTHWVPVYIPNLPWRLSPVLFAFETPFVAALAISFFIGCLVTFAGWRKFHRQFLLKQGDLRQHVMSLEKTLEKTQRLISTASNKKQSQNSSNQQE